MCLLKMNAMHSVTSPFLKNIHITQKVYMKLFLCLRPFTPPISTRVCFGIFLLPLIDYHVFLNISRVFLLTKAFCIVNIQMLRQNQQHIAKSVQGLSYVAKINIFYFSLLRGINTNKFPKRTKLQEGLSNLYRRPLITFITF